MSTVFTVYTSEVFIQSYNQGTFGSIHGISWSHIEKVYCTIRELLGPYMEFPGPILRMFTVQSGNFWVHHTYIYNQGTFYLVLHCPLYSIGKCY